MPSKSLSAVIMSVAVVAVLALTLYAGTNTGLAGACPVTRPQVCIEIYEPVYGVPTFRVHSNSCVACMEGAWFWIKATA